MKKSILVIVMSFCLQMVFADDYHFNNFFIGDRAASMGGAYCAIADGPEGVYYNPAGLSFSSSNYFSLSANAIQYKQMVYKGIKFNGAEESIDYTRRSFSFIPNFFGFLQKYKHFTFAFTVASPDSELYDQRDSFKIPTSTSGLKYTDNLNVDLSKTYMVYEAGPSFSFLPSKQLSIGFGLFVRYTNNREIFQQSHVFDLEDGSSQTTYSSLYRRDDIVSIVNNFGIQYMPIKYLSIGYSFSMPLHLVDVKSNKVTTLEGINSSNLAAGYFDAQVASKENDVINIFEDGLFRSTFVKQTIGVAGFITKSLVVSLDGSFYVTVQDEENEYADFHNWFTWNISTGMEWYITQNFPLRLGFFTDNANTPELENGKTDQLDHVNLYGGSFSIGYATSSMSVNLGATISGGVGKAQMIGGSTAIQDLEAFAVTVFISGGYSF
ncbi:MAG: hypothetical protein II196_07080 [Spirochaetales bacterium]|nr:hypothetical protein [Spirochaetales bacterium]